MTSTDARIIEKIRERPWLFFYGLRGLWGGFRCRVWHGWIRRKLKAGSLFRVYGRVSIIGPGKVVVGNDVHLLGDVIKPAAFMTTDPAARIIIGDHTGINGATLVAQQRIEVGPACVIAAHYITDNQNHSVYTDRMSNPAAPVVVAPVVIEEGVWVAVQTVITHGVKIGRHSVVGAGSLVRKDVPPDRLVAGNPLREIRAIGPTPTEEA